MVILRHGAIGLINGIHLRHHARSCSDNNKLTKEVSVLETTMLPVRLPAGANLFVNSIKLGTMDLKPLRQFRSRDPNSPKKC